MLDAILSRIGLRERPPVVSVVRLAGVIGGAGPLRRGRLNLADLARTLDRAFRMPHLKAVALAVNSPGGSPVQSALIHKRIRQLATEKQVQVFAFAEDVAASGGYWLACAADEIFADASSIVGSIGVIYQGFGFNDLIARYGIERRVHTAGARKALLDPFQEEKIDDVERLHTIQTDVHESFKALVRERRGERLKATETDVFDGDIWTGTQALEIGIIDGIGDLRSVMRERFGEKVKLVPVGDARGWLQRRLRTGTEPGEHGLWAEGALAAIEERLMWNRFGL